MPIFRQVKVLQAELGMCKVMLQVHEERVGSALARNSAQGDHETILHGLRAEGRRKNGIAVFTGSFFTSRSRSLAC